SSSLNPRRQTPPSASIGCAPRRKVETGGQKARNALWGSLNAALRWLWGRMRVALGWLWGAYRLAINRLWGGFDVALMWLWVALPGCAPSPAAISAFCFLLSPGGGFARPFEVRDSLRLRAIAHNLASIWRPRKTRKTRNVCFFRVFRVFRGSPPRWRWLCQARSSRFAVPRSP